MYVFNLCAFSSNKKKKLAEVRGIAVVFKGDWLYQIETYYSKDHLCEQLVWKKMKNSKI